MSELLVVEVDGRITEVSASQAARLMGASGRVVWVVGADRLAESGLGSPRLYWRVPHGTLHGRYRYQCRCGRCRRVTQGDRMAAEAAAAEADRAFAVRWPASGGVARSVAVRQAAGQ